MEVVLQWLDELDDLVYVCALASERARRAILILGLTAAATSVAAEAVTAWFVLVAVALGSVGVWGASAAAALGARELARSSA